MNHTENCLRNGIAGDCPVCVEIEERIAGELAAVQDAVEYDDIDPARIGIYGSKKPRIEIAKRIWGL